MTAPPFDVVVVSDFSEKVRRRFEIMTLYFLASWLEFGGDSRRLPLHLVCIGEPPDSVISLGKRCSAKITSHEPLLFGNFANKLRGFDISPQTDSILLMDSDILVMSDISGLSGKIGENCLAASPANGPCIVPRKDWIKIHEMLGTKYPDVQVTPLNIQLDTFQCEPYLHRKDFPPFYNGGIVYAPWKSNLGEIWLEHLKTTSAMGKRKVKISNQPPLATAVTFLQQQGFKFRLLPDEYHVRWQHIATGTVTSKRARILHTIGFGRWSAKGRENSAKQEIEIYLKNTVQLTRDLRSHRGALSQLLHRMTLGSKLRDCHRVYGVMELLYDKYVRELKA